MCMRSIPFGLVWYQLALLACFHDILLTKSESRDWPNIIEATLENMDKLITQQIRTDNITTTKNHKKYCTYQMRIVVAYNPHIMQTSRRSLHSPIYHSWDSIRNTMPCVKKPRYPSINMDLIHFTEWGCIIKKDGSLSTHLCISSLAIMNVIMNHFLPVHCNRKIHEYSFTNILELIKKQKALDSLSRNRSISIRI